MPRTPPEQIEFRYDEWEPVLERMSDLSREGTGWINLFPETLDEEIDRPPSGSSIFGTLFRRTPRVALVSETWDTPDGDVVDVDLLPAETGRPGVIVLHGLEGSTRARYVRGTLALAAARGWNAAALKISSA